MTKLYSLSVNGAAVLEVYAEDSGLPLRPRLRRDWLRQWVAQAVREHVQSPSTTRCRRRAR